MTQSAPTIAQNVLPVIEDPPMSCVPWPNQTAPARTSRAPTTRLAMITQLHTHDRHSRFATAGTRITIERSHWAPA
jgi:hypothetical protein